MNIRTLVTAEAIIVAGLLVWAQLWTNTYDVYEKAGSPVWCVSLYMATIYAAVLFSLLSIVLAIWSLRKKVVDWSSKLAAGFAGFSVTVTILVITSSLYSVWHKALHGWQQWRPLWPCDCQYAATEVTVGATIAGVVILITWLAVSWFWLANKLLENQTNSEEHNSEDNR